MQKENVLRPSPLKSVGAIVAGLLATVVTTTLVDSIMHSTGVFPEFGVAMSNELFILALAYRIVLNAFGCMITAKLAPYYPLTHAYILGGIGMSFATAGAYIHWDKGPGWYAIANIVIALPCAWLGWKMYAKQTAKRQSLTEQ